MQICLKIPFVVNICYCSDCVILFHGKTNYTSIMRSVVMVTTIKMLTAFNRTGQKFLIKLVIETVFYTIIHCTCLLKQQTLQVHLQILIGYWALYCSQRVLLRQKPYQCTICWAAKYLSTEAKELWICLREMTFVTVAVN